MSSALFPHDMVRDIQSQMVELIIKSLDQKKHAIIHAPTGLGKTAASIAPALRDALKTNKTIFFVTSRNTQHKIALDTIKQINQKHNVTIQATDFVGKKWMCIQPGIDLLRSNEFGEYCRALREDGQCEFYENLKEGEKLSVSTKAALDELSKLSPAYIERLISLGKDYKLCPYELAQHLARRSQIIITDYYYIFNPAIRNNFFKKTNKSLDKSIIIVDEAHNLHERIKDLSSVKISTPIINRAINEAKKNNLNEIESILSNLPQILRLLSDGEDENYVDKNKFIEILSSLTDYTDFIDMCYDAADEIREKQKQSYIGSIAQFLDMWLGSDIGFTRILSRKKTLNEDQLILSYRCLDPSIIAKEVLEESDNVFMMSGTLIPTAMYRELLGFNSKNTEEVEFPSPFPEENRLNLIVAKTSTKFKGRSEQQFQNIAKILSDIINETPGNSAIFFPSYYLMNEIYSYMKGVDKTIFQENPQMNRDEKEEMLNKFRTYNKTGAALLAATTGSFGEGIDLPGDELKTVVIVGLPLTRPDLETKSLIKYYDEKFGKGWDYGYVFPAFNKVIQSAGRCIRSETDKGVVVFLDERYTWNNYMRCFPKNWRMEISLDNYKDKIKHFFENQ